VELEFEQFMKYIVSLGSHLLHNLLQFVT